MTQTSRCSPAFITNPGGTTALAEAFLFQSIAEGTAYFNIHSTFAVGGEIRGFLEPLTVPADPSTCGGDEGPLPLTASPRAATTLPRGGGRCNAYPMDDTGPPPR